MEQETIKAFWGIPASELLAQLATSPQGLSEAEAKERLKCFGANLLKPKGRPDTLTLLLYISAAELAKRFFYHRIRS
jgi:Mg2+-importing ATPase